MSEKVNDILIKAVNEFCKCYPNTEIIDVIYVQEDDNESYFQIRDVKYNMYYVKIFKDESKETMIGSDDDV